MDLKQLTKGKYRALVISTVESNNSILKETFDDIGFAFDICTDARGAAELFKAGQYTIAIIDLVLLINLNMQVLQELRELSRGVIPILITGTGLDRLAEKFKKEGIHYFLDRPVSKDQVEEVLRNVFERLELEVMAAEAFSNKKSEMIDAGTGLYNKDYFIFHLDQEVNFSKTRGRNSSLILMGIDNYISIVRNEGEDTGDSLMKMMSERVMQSCRKYDVVARYNPDKLAIILSGVSSEKVHEIAHRFTNSLPPEAADRDSYNSTSIGFSSFPSHGSSGYDLLKKAGMVLLKNTMDKTTAL